MGGGVIQLAIARPVTVTVGVILVILFGVLSLIGIPIQLTPDVTIPSVTVATQWPGATPTEIEAEILDKQEQALKSLPGLARMTSEARREQASIELELRVGTSLDEALVRVANLLAQVPDYPETARLPVISTANSAGPPLAVAVIQSDPPGREVAEYRSWVQDFILPPLERIRGVAHIRFVGGRDQEVHIDFDPSRLAARRVTLAEIVNAVRAELVDVSAGDIPIGKRRYVVRTQVVPLVPRELERTVIKTFEDGVPVLLGDVARVRPGLRKPEAVGMVNGAPSMALLFYRQAGSNVLEVTREIHRVVAELQRGYLGREGLEMRIVSDQTDYIEGALDLVRNNLLIGAVLATAVLLLFLRSFGASAVVALSIPVSVIGTALAMSLMGRTINVVSLAGMAFAVGMVVDNSIVVLENIDTWRRREANIARASLVATKEVWGAILASTLTTAAVFLPIIGWQDEVGELLRDIAVALSTAVFVSLAVSVIVIPSFSAQLLRQRQAAPPAPTRVATVPAIVRWVTESGRRSLLAAGGGIVGAAALGAVVVPPLEYLPTGNRNVVFGLLVPPPGFSVHEVERMGKAIQARLLEHTGIDKDGVPALDRSFFVGGPDSVFLGAVAQDPRRARDMLPFVQGVLGELPSGTIAVANQGSLFGRRLGGDRSIEIDISGPDLQALTDVGARMMMALHELLPAAQVRPIPGLDPGAPEWHVEPIREQASRFGLSSRDIGLLVDAYIDGSIIGEVGTSGARKRDVVLRAADLAIDGPAALLNAPAAIPRGHIVNVSEFARIQPRIGPTVIQRIERRRAITLQISPPDDIALEKAVAMVRDGVVEPLRRGGEIPRGVRIDYAGTAGQLEEAKTRFGGVLVLAVLITFLLLSALFEDFLAPLAILVSVPLAAVGGILGLRLVGATLEPQPLDMLTAMGFVILIGVVVNNAILIVDGALARMRAQAMSLQDALSDAVRWRLRPILMSALTSLAGLLPLVLFPGFGSELYRGVGAIVLGGLALSTALSLFLVPAVFAVLWRLRRPAAAR